MRKGHEFEMPQEVREAFRAEEQLLGGASAQLKATVVQSAAAAATQAGAGVGAATHASTAALSSMATKVAVSVAMVGAVGTAMTTWQPEPVEPPQPTPVVEQVAPVEPAALPPETPRATKPAQVTVDEVPPPIPSSAVTKPMRRHPPRPAVSPKPPAPHPEAPPAQPAAAQSTLGSQLETYERGAAALQRGDANVAAAEFRDYLERYPEGSLQREAQLSLLEALVQSKDFEGAVGLANTLLPTAGDRRPELLRVRGEAKARLGHCADAESDLRDAAEGGATTAIDTIVETCRNAHSRPPH